MSQEDVGPDMEFYNMARELAGANPVEEFIKFMKELKALNQRLDECSSQYYFRYLKHLDDHQTGFVNRIILMVFLDYFDINIEELEDEIDGS